MVVTRRPPRARNPGRKVIRNNTDQAAEADLVVDAVGVDVANTSYQSAKPFVLTSVGALPILLQMLMTPHRVTNGAIGGFDILEAVADQSLSTYHNAETRPG